MIYEMRTYTLTPGSQAIVAHNAGETALRIRGDDYGKLEGFWLTEIGPLNQVMHLWSFDSLDERQRLRSELFQNEAWVKEYVPLVQPHLMRQDVRLMHALRPLQAPASAGNVYEFRNYRLKPGGVGQWAPAFLSALSAREKYSQAAGVWHTEASQPNEVCHLWVYSDLNARAQARANAVADPEWQAFLAKAVPLMEEMHSAILLPAAHSPMR